MITSKKICFCFMKMIFVFLFVVLPFSQISASDASVSIQNLFPSASVNVGQTVFWNTVASGFTNPAFSASDSVMTSSLTPGNMNQSGGFNWTPKNQDVGGHTITVTVTDSFGHSASASQSISVGATASATSTSLSPGNAIAPRQTVTFTVTPTGFTNPTYTSSDSASGSSVSSGNINSSGVFSWTPNQGDLGMHIITVTVSDSLGDTASLSQTIMVSNGSVSILTMSPGLFVNAGTLFSLTATSTGMISPDYSISDSFSGTSVPVGGIGKSGIFVWTPTGNDVGAHYINIHATDSIGNNASLNIMVTVKPKTDTLRQSETDAIVGSFNSTTSVKYVFTRALSVGSSNKDVIELQKKLISLGLYTGPITGYFGPLTKVAVKKFQAKYGIQQLGNVGPATRTMLNKI